MRLRLGDFLTLGPAFGGVAATLKAASTEAMERRAFVLTPRPDRLEQAAKRLGVRVELVDTDASGGGRFEVFAPELGR